MAADLHIRDATPGDADAILALIAEGFDSYRDWAGPEWEPPTGGDPDRLATLRIGPTEADRSWVAEAPFSGLAGTARMAQTSRAIPEVRADDVILRELFVASEFWGSGVATALLEQVLTAARTADYRTIWLATPSGASRARAFYERHGFTARESGFDEHAGLDLTVYSREVHRSRDLRRAQDRRFGRGPYVLGLQRHDRIWGTGFPFDLPAIAGIEAVRLDRPITLLAGDNGTGKSTIVEALAQAIGFGEEGGELERSGENILPAVPRPILGGALSPVLTPTKPRSGYFLRAESFYNLAAFVDRGVPNDDQEIPPDLSLYGGIPLHGQSHGQSFLALASNRFGEGFYLLDEPEAALSVTGTLALLAVLVRAARDGAQFVIATHSPVLLACPDARIYELDAAGAHERAYDDLEAVRLTRGFLDSPARYLRAVFDED